jgi:hypothetical protein
MVWDKSVVMFTAPLQGQGVIFRGQIAAAESRHAIVIFEPLEELRPDDVEIKLERTPGESAGALGKAGRHQCFDVKKWSPPALSTTESQHNYSPLQYLLDTYHPC